jgi:hypothetical protein
VGTSLFYCISISAHCPLLTVLAGLEAHEGRVDGELVALLRRNVARVEGVAARAQDV